MSVHSVECSRIGPFGSRIAEVFVNRPLTIRGAAQLIEIASNVKTYIIQ